MSAKFLLALIAINGLCLSANAAFAATDSPPASTQNITQLSQIIANLIDVDDRHLVELAINRALLAQQINEVQVPPPPVMVTAGVPRLPTQTDKEPNSDDKTVMPDNLSPVGLIAIPKDGAGKSTPTDNKQSTSDDKQPTIRGRVPNFKMPKIGRIIKQKEPSIGQMKTSESENTQNSSTTADPKTAR